MAFTSNISSIIEKLEAIKSSTVTPAPEFSDAMLSALNAGMGKMKFRIFNKGLDAENVTLGKYQGKKSKVTGAKFGKTKYSIFGTILLEDEIGERDRKSARKNLKGITDTLTEYEKLRVSKGRQIAFKDLELEGALRRAIETVKINNTRLAISITSETSALIAGYQEEQIGKIRGSGKANIFSFTKEEYDFTVDEYKAAIRQVITKLFYGY